MKNTTSSDMLLSITERNLVKLKYIQYTIFMHKNAPALFNLVSLIVPALSRGLRFIGSQNRVYIIFSRWELTPRSVGAGIFASRGAHLRKYGILYFLKYCPGAV